MEPVEETLSPYEKWRLSSSNLRLVLNSPYAGVGAGQFGKLKRGNTEYVWNYKTNNIIATIKRNGREMIVRYRPRSWYAGIIDDWAHKPKRVSANSGRLYKLIVLPSTNVGRRHRRIMHRLHEVRNSRFDMLANLCLSLNTPNLRELGGHSLFSREQVTTTTARTSRERFGYINVDTSALRPRPNWTATTTASVSASATALTDDLMNEVARSFGEASYVAPIFDPSFLVDDTDDPEL